MSVTGLKSNNKSFQIFLGAYFLATAYVFWRTFKVEVDETNVKTSKDAIRPEPRSVREAHQDEEVQASEDGTGPYFHRHYEIQIEEPDCTPAELMTRLREDINSCSPGSIAHFEKTKSESDKAGEFSVGDEFRVHILGPWDGPVRVVESDDSSFTFVTRDGHLEAGGIRFRVREADENRGEERSASKRKAKGKEAPKPAAHGPIIFEIESWSRSRDGLVDLVYDKLQAARFAQTQMWAKFCNGVAEISGGRAAGKVQVRSEKAEMDPKHH